MKTSKVLFKSTSNWGNLIGISILLIALFGYLLSLLLPSGSQLYKVIFGIGCIIIPYTLSCLVLFTAEIYIDKICVNYFTRFYNREKIVFGKLVEAICIRAGAETPPSIRFTLETINKKKYSKNCEIPEKYKLTERLLTDLYELLSSNNVKVRDSRYPKWSKK